MVHLAAWSGLRAAELAGLQVGDVSLPKPSLNPNAPAKPGTLRVDRTVARIGGELTYVTPKTKGSRRRVPLTPATTTLLRDYLAEHPHQSRHPRPRCFPACACEHPAPPVYGPKPPMGSGHGGWQRGTLRQATALADLTAADAAERLMLDWTTPLRTPRSIRPSSARRCCGPTGLRRPPRYRPAEVSRAPAHLRELVHRGGPATAGDRAVHGPREGHHDARRVRAPVHTDDHADAMAALGAMDRAAAESHAGNVISLHG